MSHVTSRVPLNPFWRSETLGSYGLVFNTIMHYRNLSAGEEPPLTDDE